MRDLRIIDPEIADAIHHETKRQALTIDLIASTNFISQAVLDVQASVFARTTMEGYPGARYHGGHQYVDVVEQLAIKRAKKLFGAEHANVQPHSGVSANLGVFVGMLQAGDGILGMKLDHGGHLSHGYPASLSGKYYRASFYGVSPDSELIDYDEMLNIASKEKPRLIIVGGSAYPRIIDFAQVRRIADKVGAYVLADVAHYAGLIAGGEYPSPFPYADFVTFTTQKTLRGVRGGVILCKKKFAKRIDAGVFPGCQGSIHVHLVAGKAVTFRLAMTEEFRKYIRSVVWNAKILASELTERGYRPVSGGTDTHCILLDLRARNLTGKVAEISLDRAGIIVNKNKIPFDPLPANITSGIRLGTAAVTSRGFGEKEMVEIANIIDNVLSSPDDEGTLRKARNQVRELCIRFPLYMDRWGMELAELDDDEN